MLVIRCGACSKTLDTDSRRVKSTHAVGAGLRWLSHIDAAIEIRVQQSGAFQSNMVTHLIPTLSGSANTAQEDGHVQGKRVTPPVSTLVADDSAFLVVEALNPFEASWVLCNQGALFEIAQML